MALNLTESAKLALNNGETKRAGVIATFARQSQWLAAMPTVNIAGSAYAYNQEGVLPGIAFRGINQAFVASEGIVNPYTEALKIAGGDVDVDTSLIRMHGPAIRSTHEQMKVKSLAAALSTALIKGDSTADPRSFDGFQRRIPLSGSSQLINAGSTNGGDALTLTKLDELIDTVAGPNKVLMMNKAMVRRLSAAQRNPSVGGYITFEPNAFGQRVMFYNGVPILVEYPENDGTEALAFDEVGSGGATATACSIYCAALAPGYVWLAQNGEISVRDLGEIHDAPVARTRVEWHVSPVVEHPRAIARLRGISNAAVAA
jgi:hypothetical protein